MEKITLDDLDYKILKLISNDARISFLEVARLCSVSGASVHQRVQKMIGNQVIVGSEFRLNLNRIGFESCAYIGICIDREDDIDKAIDQLKAVPEVVECHCTVGSCDLFVKVYARNNVHLFEIIHTWLRPLGEVHSGPVISYKEAFRRQIIFADE